MRYLLLTFAIINLSAFILSCDKSKEVIAGQETQGLTEKDFADFPAGTTLDSFLERFNLEEAIFDALPNQPMGHEQGWYHLKEGDLMISATLSGSGVMLLDQVPWILTRAEQNAAEQPTTAPQSKSK